MQSTCFRWCKRYLMRMSFLALMLQATIADAGVVSGDQAIICNIAGNDSKECSPLRTSVFEGRFSANLGLDLGLAVRSQKEPDLSYDDPGAQVGRDFKLSDAVGVRFGFDLRFYFFDWLGIAATVGVDGNKISTSSSDSSGSYRGSRTTTGASNRAMLPNDHFSLNYIDSYVGATVYIPAQKLNQMGLFLTARRMAAKKAEVTFSLDGGLEVKREAEALQSPQEIAFGCFVSIFYLSYVNRFESWRVIPQSGERYSNVQGRAEGIELGFSGPVWTIWP